MWPTFLASLQSFRSISEISSCSSSAYRRLPPFKYSEKSLRTGVEEAPEAAEASFLPALAWLLPVELYLRLSRSSMISESRNFFRLEGGDVLLGGRTSSMGLTLLDRMSVLLGGGCASDEEADEELELESCRFWRLSLRR